MNTATAKRQLRIAAILEVLQHGGCITMQTLAWKFSVSITTINRDIEALRDSGHCIGGSTGCGGGVMLRPDKKRAA